eukprot:2884981-Pleurochrysis_carterae.AAC.1
MGCQLRRNGQCKREVLTRATTDRRHDLTVTDTYDGQSRAGEAARKCECDLPRRALDTGALTQPRG